MNTVDPIREISDIQKMKSVLLASSYRDYLFFLLGINTGLRISDILNLKVSDVRNKYHIIIREQKTGKEKKFMLNDSLKEELDRFISSKGDDDFIFESKRTRNKPLERTRAYFILNRAAETAGLKIRIGTHTLRKTFGFHFYQRTKDIALLQQLFNHSGQSVTLRYIGINQSVSDEAMREFNL
ncbi:MAG TPA: site-specific integrase [bacterium]|nr:site-specific integrase [bacterium]